MISRLVRSKASVPHDIVRAELAAPPMVVEALFQTVCMLHRFQDMDRDQIAYRAFTASRDLAMGGDTSCWYAQTRDWLSRHGIDIDRLPPLQYDTQAPTYHLSHSERNRVIRQELWHTYIQRTWIDPVRPLPPIREERLHQSSTAREASQTTITQFFSAATTPTSQTAGTSPTTSTSSGLTLAQAEAQRRRRRPRTRGYRTPHIHRQDIQRIERTFHQHMEDRLQSTHWSTTLQSAFYPAPMYHILHPVPCH
ncbi:hypothetical protein L7F22_058820 [Adiantum nelumboides]|nr:hypothetical protein [Adiantum nelumboides]MCO5604650.1 hypothetical protein [Adiantum nelumboides]